MALGPNEWEWWWGAWKSRIRCGECQGLMLSNAPCPVCGHDYTNIGPQEVVIDGRTFLVPQAFAGALDWSPYVMLQLMHRDWIRPLGDLSNDHLPNDNRPSPHVLVVLLFWIYFETLMGWFYEAATSKLRSSISADLLTRYGYVGMRVDRLHRALFDTTYWNDLDALGHSSVRQHLDKVQRQRNAFAHGNPEALSDALVQDTVNLIPKFHDAWIQSFNMRCAQRR